MNAAKSSGHVPAFRMRGLRALVLLACWTICVGVASPDILTSETPAPSKEASPFPLYWSNRQGRTLVATYAGLDGEDHVLLRVLGGDVYRYPICDLSADSQHLARCNGRPSFISWTNRLGQSIQAMFCGMDGTGRILLQLPTGVVHTYPLAELKESSQLQAKNHGRPLRPSVLILGDSMSLGGFGKQLDRRMRNLPQVERVATFMAGGTNPLSWLKIKPFTRARTASGYWRIKPRESSPEIDEFVDIYDSHSGHKPSSHTIPKLERLLGLYSPDVLVIQCGNNFFSAFDDGRTIRLPYHRQFIQSQIKPFVSLLKAYPSALRKIYWVSPPQAGSVSSEIQDFVYQEIRSGIEPLGEVIDSRPLTSYPYKMMASDQEHFWGKEAEDWADCVYERIAQSMASVELWSAPRLCESSQVELVTPREMEKTQIIEMNVRLVAKTATPSLASFAPYQEVLVGYRYAVEKVTRGHYDAREILVMHPAYIRSQLQPIEFEIGSEHHLTLLSLGSDSPWASVKRENSSGLSDLDPFILLEDENRHPDLTRSSDDHSSI